jgi:hypothetical protein
LTGTSPHRSEAGPVDIVTYDTGPVTFQVNHNEGTGPRSQR